MYSCDYSTQTSLLYMYIAKNMKLLLFHVFSIIVQIYIPKYTYNVLLNLKEFWKRLILIQKHVFFFKFSPPQSDAAKQRKLVG